MKKLLLLSAVLAGLSSSPAWSQIKVGQTSGFTGAVAASVKESTEGAKLYFDCLLYTSDAADE